ncbi:MAG: hypothetical protein IJM81_01535 [Prevotella sp.]|nr:hypothetical protein [Prevotella sp.]
MMETTNELLNDYEHSVTNKIAKFASLPDFPRMDDYGITRADLDDYLFDKQAILDSEGSEKSRYVTTGILIILPIIVIAAFPPEKLPGRELFVFVGIAIGLALSAIVYFARKAIVRIKLRKLYQPDLEHYIEAVLNYR